MDDTFDHAPGDLNLNPPNGYALSGKIMLSAIIILFAVVVFMICLHIYARWYLRRARSRQILRRGHRHTQLVFYLDPNNPHASSSSSAIPNPGLDVSVLETLPVFVYSSSKAEEGLECAVCLSEFEENEKGRLLPKCKHSFHTDCIDMWFHSHSTCPICRSPVEPQILDPVSEYPPVSDEPVDPEPGSSSGVCPGCRHEEEQVSMASASSSSFGARRKGVDLVRVTIEVPGRNETTEDELRMSSPASQGYKSPGGRLLSLKRLLSMNRRASSAISPSSGVGTSCGGGVQPSSSELDIEQGRGESTQLTRAQTPR